MNSPRLQKWLVNWSSCPDVEGVYNTLVQLNLNSVSSIKHLAWTKQSGKQYVCVWAILSTDIFVSFESLEFESYKNWLKSLCFSVIGWKLSALHYSPLWWRQNSSQSRGLNLTLHIHKGDLKRSVNPPKSHLPMCKTKNKILHYALTKNNHSNRIQYLQKYTIDK